MATVIGIHAGIVGVWAQDSQVNISFGQPAIEMALDFSSAESNTSEPPTSAQPTSAQPTSAQPIDTSTYQFVKPEPDLASEPEPEIEPVKDLKHESTPDSKPESKPLLKSIPKPEPNIKKQTKKTVSKNDTHHALTQKTESSQIKTSTGTQQQTADQAPVPAQFMSISQLIFDGGPPVPHYPKQARLKGEEGLVVVRISIDRWGSVEKSQVFKSSGFDLLDHAALDATTNMRFKPYQFKTMSHHVMVDIPFNFILSP
jgi:protein TonB